MAGCGILLVQNLVRANTKVAILAFENGLATAYANRLQTGAAPMMGGVKKAQG